MNKMKGKTISMHTGIISAIAIASMFLFFKDYSFPEWLAYFFLMPLLYSVLVWTNFLGNLYSFKDFLKSAFVFIVVVTFGNVRNVNLVWVYQALSTIAGIGAVWLLILYIRPKNEEKQQQTNQQINE